MKIGLGNKMWDLPSLLSLYLFAVGLFFIIIIFNELFSYFKWVGLMGIVPCCYFRLLNVYVVVVVVVMM